MVVASCLLVEVFFGFGGKRGPKSAQSVFSFLSPALGVETNELKVTELLLLLTRLLLELAILSKLQCLR
jgi:hypothetical protein